MQKLSDVQMLIGQLYETMHVREYHADMEKEVLAELEAIKLELEPLEQVGYERVRHSSPVIL